MDYKELITRSFTIIWRQKWLWIFGFFAGGGAGGSLPRFNFNYSSGNLRQLDPETRLLLDEARIWALQHLPLILTIVGILIATIIVFVIISFVARGALVRGVYEIEAGAEARVGGALRAGLHYFWRVLGLSLVLALFVLVPLLFFALPLIVGLVTMGPSAVVAAGGAIFLLLGVVVIIPLAVVVGIVGSYAIRFVVIEDRAVFASISDGWRLFRAKLGASLLIWLIAVAVGFGFGMALALAFVILAVPVGVIGVVTFMGGFKPLLLALLIVLVLAIVAALFVVTAGFNAYISTYWTLAWLRLTRPPEPILQPSSE